MSRLLGPAIWKFVVQSNRAETNKVQVFTLIKHYNMVQETSTYGLKTAWTGNRKPEYVKRTPLVDFFVSGYHYCKRVTSRIASQLIKLLTSNYFAAAKVHSSIP